MRNEKLAAQIEKYFEHHQPKDEREEKYEALRFYAKEYAEMINELCPDSDEKSLAVKQVEDSVFCAITSINRAEKL